MIRALIVLALAGCPAAGPRFQTTFVADAALSGIVKGTGTTDANMPAAGLTAIIDLPGGEVAAISDEDGAFVMKQAVPAGTYTLLIYYDNTKLEQVIQVQAGHVTVVRITNLKEPIVL